MQCVAGYTNVKVPTKRVKKSMRGGQIEHLVQQDPFERLQITSNEHTRSTVSVLLSQYFFDTTW